MAINSWLILRIKAHTKCIFRNFHSLKINRMTPFCNLFMKRPSYTYSVTCLAVHRHCSHSRNQSYRSCFCCANVVIFVFPPIIDMLYTASLDPFCHTWFLPNRFQTDQTQVLKNDTGGPLSNQLSVNVTSGRPWTTVNTSTKLTAACSQWVR